MRRSRFSLLTHRQSSRTSHAPDATPSPSHSPSKASHKKAQDAINSLCVLCFFLCLFVVYGSASTLKKNLNAPVCCTPSRKLRLMLCPGSRGVGNVIVPALIVLLSAPPKG